MNGNRNKKNPPYHGFRASRVASSMSMRRQNSRIPHGELVLSSSSIQRNNMLSQHNRNIEAANGSNLEASRSILEKSRRSNELAHAQSVMEKSNNYSKPMKPNMVELAHAHNVSREQELYSRRMIEDAQAELLAATNQAEMVAASNLYDVSRQNSLKLMEASKHLEASRQNSLTLWEASKRLDASRQNSYTLLEASKRLEVSRQNSLTLLEASKLLEASRQDSMSSMSLLEASKFLDVSRQDSLKLFEVSHDTGMSRDEFYSKLLGDQSEKLPYALDGSIPLDQRPGQKSFAKKPQRLGPPVVEEVSRQESFSKIFDENDEKKKAHEHPAIFQNSEAFRSALSSLSIQNIYSNYPHAVANNLPHDAGSAALSSRANLENLHAHRGLLNQPFVSAQSAHHPLGISGQVKAIEDMKRGAQMQLLPGSMYPGMTSTQQIGAPELGVPNALILLNNPYQLNPMAHQSAYLNNNGWSRAMHPSAQHEGLNGIKTPSHDMISPVQSGPPVNSADVTLNPKRKGRGRPKRNPKEGWPKRPLSAYNIFFKREREKLLKSMKEPPPVNNSNSKTTRTRKNRQAKHGKISFSDLAKTIGSKWKKLSQEEKNEYEIMAAFNLQKYREDLREFTEKRNKARAPE